MHILGIGAGDEVILPSISFVGAANAVVACGAIPRFCDVDPRTLNPIAADIERVITPRTKAMIPLHYGGVPCDMESICALLAVHNLVLIEDCAISVASQYNNQACGTFGEIGVWSFDAMKTLVTGDGGMLYCHTPDATERARKLLFLGLESKSGFTNSAATRWWEYELAYPGRQAGMNDITSTIGLVQLQKLAGAIARRRAITERYDEGLGDCAWLQVPHPRHDDFLLLLLLGANGVKGARCVGALSAPTWHLHHLSLFPLASHALLRRGSLLAVCRPSRGHHPLSTAASIPLQ